jgi:DNA-binding FrmR family transcriptional regulator
MKHKDIYNRLRRIEGQIRGIEDMVANERQEQEILIQLEAAKSSLASTVVALIESMLEVGPDSKLVITEEQIRPILKIIKK